MRDLDYYKRHLIDGIPFRFRAYFGEIIDSYSQSQLMLHFISNAIELSSDDPAYLPDCAFAMGSFGRQDGSAHISDFDVIYIYNGGFNADRRNKIRETIRNIILQNKILNFDYRDEIEDNSFDFDGSHAYPVLSSEELMQEQNYVRQIQIISESRAIYQFDNCSAIKRDLLNHFGYHENHLETNFEPLIEKLDNFKNEYCDFYGDAINEAHHRITNIKIIKLFALREFFYIASLFSLADIMIGITVNNNSADECLKKISAPSAHKIFSYSLKRNSHLISLIDESLETQKPDIRAILEEEVNKLPLGIRSLTNSGEEGFEEISHLRKLTLGVLMNYNYLLRILHDPQFITKIKGGPINFGAWAGIPEFLNIQRRRDDLINNSKLLAVGIFNTLEYIEIARHDYDFDAAKRLLDKIVNYTLTINR